MYHHHAHSIPWPPTTVRASLFLFDIDALLIRCRPEYGALIFGLLLLIFEALARLVTILLPDVIVRRLYQYTRSAFHAFARSPYGAAKPQDPLKLRAERIRQAKDFEELCAVYGYTPEEHLVQTKDGYLLVIHRLPSRKGEARARPGTPTGKPVVYLHHGVSNR